MSRPNATALIAEDEPLLAMSLEADLAAVWPELRVLANVRHGEAAVAQALALRPDLVFLDIRMPGLGGIDAAQAIDEDWPEGQHLPLLVFVTAYDQYALQAFEHAAIDYVLKPVQPDRLAKTCARVQAALGARDAARPPDSIEAALGQLRGLLGATGIAAPAAPPLTVIQASVGTTIHLVPIADVLYFDAADKYIRVVTAAREYLIRISLRQLLPQLDARVYWQIHRGTIVRSDAVAAALRDESGRVQLKLRQRPELLSVSRLYAHLFKAM
jgi:DNA-binding LytR/AlgR family response regulator